MGKLIARAAAGLALLACLTVARAAEPPGFEGFDSFVERELARWNVPGAAIAVVRDGEILFVKGYGLRDIEKRLPMTSRTTMPIGSITKTMVAISVAKLVRQGRLSWDRPVRAWAPDFHLASDAVAAQVTLRDMLTHRTSFNGSDWAWYGAPQTPEDLYRNMRHFELRGGIRERFQYSDLVYGAAGFIVARAAGVASWDDLARRDILVPLGMGSTGFSLAEFQASAEPSTPYGSDEQGRPVRFTPLESKWINPAGGFVYASTQDMARYLAMLAGGGKLGEVRVIEERDLADITTPQVIMSPRSPSPELGMIHYAMGFTVRAYRDRTVVYHNGINDGWCTRLSWFPHNRSGVYIAVNGMEGAMQGVLSNAALDRLLGVPPADWGDREMQARDRSRAQSAEARAKRAQGRKSGTRASRELRHFAHAYLHPGYGRVTILEGAEGLRLGFRGYEWPLQHVHYDIFEGLPSARSYAMDPLANMSLQFVSGFDGEVSGLRLRFYPSAEPVEFTRDGALPNK